MRLLLRGAALALALFPVQAVAQSAGVPVRLMVFGDATFSETERDRITDGFSLGQVVGHMNASLSPRLLVFVEGTLTPTGGSPVATLERLIVRYDVNDWLKLSGGRYHNPVSYWNTAYHHGSWLQPSVARPHMVRFGTPLLPIHFNGVLAEGTIHSGPLLVGYEAGFGNGRQRNIAVPGDAGDDDGHLALLGGIRLRSLAVPGAEVGAHAYTDHARDVFDEPVDERILSGHVALQRQVELIAEYVLIRHESEDDATGGDAFGTNAWYVHLGYRLPSPAGLRPYVRYESIEPGDGDPVFDPPFAPGPDIAYEAWIGGVRWDFSDYAALKAEYRDEQITVADAPDDGWSVLLNASFVIPNLLGSGPSAAAH